MHARVSVFRMRPDETDAGVEYGRGTIPQMMEMEGFREDSLVSPACSRPRHR